MTEKSTTNIVKIGNTHFFDLEKKCLFTLKQTIKLNRAEREVLNELIVASPAMVSKEALLSAGWARKEVATTSLFQTIRTLRIKLKEQNTGDTIVLIPKLGYHIITNGYADKQDINIPIKENKKALSASKNKPLFLVGGIIIAFLALISYFLILNKETSYNYLVELDDDNNTIVLISQHADDLSYLINYTDTYIKPSSSVTNKLLFIAKSNEFYSIAVCDKTKSGCKKNTSHAVSFKHNDINLSWPIFEKELESLGSMPVLQADTATRSGAKSYHHFIDNGLFSKNLTQHFVHQKKDKSWSFTSIGFKLNTKGTEFVTTSFRGGSLVFNDSVKKPFISSITTTPEYFYWVLNENEQKKLDLNTPGEIERHGVNLFREEIKITTHLLYTQLELMLWFSEDLGFIWYQKENNNGSGFSELFGQSFPCYAIGLGLNSNCEQKNHPVVP
ncbi:winged helix-turn-helix domain-containing protein [Photobacterium minamisatsumaniensis]|uniref:winged helix-turn-helix domain-containing protein n=1 Tax=Photobacterium minamisatsumaniensis TaxID=2910233 RepID=UPI003D11B86C